MTVKISLQQSMAEELLAAANYRARAHSARNGGDETSAELWEHIAEEEDGHYDDFQTRYHALLELLPPPRPRLADYTTPGDIQYPPVMHRPFPQTPGDWVDLGYDIEAKLTSQMDRNEVRHQVAVATANEPGDIDDAKRWLVNKARELGID